MNETVTEIKELGNYILEIVRIEDFKKYYYEHKEEFSSTVAINSYLKAVDIPPKFYKEQPSETQEQLLDNREVFVREHKKYWDKVIVVLRSKADSKVLNACRLSTTEVKRNYEQLKSIDNIRSKFEHRSFVKDGYITYVISEDIKNNVDNQVLVVDFPILMNKKAIIHKALYTLPNETFATPVEHIHYLTSEDINFGLDYSNIEDAIKDQIEFISSTDRVAPAPENILRESDVVALALVEAGTISHSYLDKVSSYITDNTQGVLTTDKLESLVLDYDETFNSYKQVTSLRSVSGMKVLRILQSDEFNEVVEELENLATIGETVEL